MPPPVPPRVKEGRMTAGSPVDLEDLPRLLDVPGEAALRDLEPDAGHGLLEQLAVLAHLHRAAAGADEPDAEPVEHAPPASSTARLSAVCPPTVGSSASGRSRSRMASTASGVSGSTYVRSAYSGSVMMVAGFELTSETRMPSCLRALMACVPE